MSRCQTSGSAFCAGSSVADSTTSTKVGYQRPYIALLTETEYLDFSYKCKALIISMSDCIVPQRDIEAVSTWSTSNHLELNVNKCYIVSYTRKNNIILFPYSIDLMKKDLNTNECPNNPYNIHE
ncbi:unnamed protein product [Callosobruchus maculatus]|uniref:Reverse transcriptase domain-containing protein n=1 Tax=Callosobruchus maculatus TaxID=64391 RepID=A0A653CDN6_CALMS|nr:unnamed protein product [Callosobruchus maculatus]